jgi:ankyrin repeat protein
MEARRVDRNTYDIFFGTQWSDHVRVRQTRHNTYRVSGMRVPHEVLKDLHNILAWNMPITYGQSMEQMLHNVSAIQ